MQPLSYDTRILYRKYISDTDDDSNGMVQPIYSTSGPYRLAFVPGQLSRTLTEQGFAYDQTVYFVIADGCTDFKAGDILTDGRSDLFEVISVKTWPTEQTMYVRGL